MGDCITDLVGPLGKATHIEKVGTVLACGGNLIKNLYICNKPTNIHHEQQKRKNQYRLLNESQLRYFSEKVVQLEVEAPLIAKARKPGNFVIVRVGEKGERMPLTISNHLI